MHVVVTGGTGFAGRALVNDLIKDGHEVSVLTRNPDGKPNQPKITYIEWLAEGSAPEKELKNVDAIVNLAGASINARWTKERKEQISQSRIKATRAVNELIGKLDPKPEVLVSASAVGYYGLSEMDTFTEKSEPNAVDFLASVVRRWESEAAEAENRYGVRTVFTRFGVILGNGGALPSMALPYKLGVGGTVGSGRQWLSWIHIEDVIGLIRFAIVHPEIHGPLNVTAPEPVKMKTMGQTIAEVLHRPHWMPVPSFAMKIALGEMSSLLLKGQRVLPEKALKNRYSFRYPDLKPALKQLLNDP